MINVQVFKNSHVQNDESRLAQYFSTGDSSRKGEHQLRQKR
jgi:hypothetical protein